MTALVIDASALAAIVFNEPSGPAVLSRIRGHLLHAPDLLFHELTNVAWKKARRLEPAQARAVAQELALGLSQTVTLHTAPHNDVFALALSARLTAYDATYLWLAQKLRLPLVTLDAALERAALSQL